MTREEQIDWLCRLRAGLNNGIIFTPWNKEFTEALTGILEQQPCEDCISRQAAIDTLIGWETEPLDEDIERELRKLPSVRPELNCKNCVFRMGYGTGIDKGILNTIPKKMKEGD